MKIAITVVAILAAICLTAVVYENFFCLYSTTHFANKSVLINIHQVKIGDSKEEVVALMGHPLAITELTYKFSEPINPVFPNDYVVCWIVFNNSDRVSRTVVTHED